MVKPLRIEYFINVYDSCVHTGEDINIKIKYKIIRYKINGCAGPHEMGSSGVIPGL